MKLLAILLVAVCVRAKIFPGECPSVTLQSGFNISNYMGKWYETFRSADMIWERGTCNYAQYFLQENKVNVTNYELLDGNVATINGYATCQTDSPAHCSVVFPNAGPPGDYEVYQTDYANYAIVYSCASAFVVNDRWIWLLTRTPNYNYTQALADIQVLGFQKSDLYFTPQVNCGSLSTQEPAIE
jgi:lipocalin